MRRPATDGRPLTKISKVRLPARLHDADHEPPRQEPDCWIHIGVPALVIVDRLARQRVKEAA